MEISRFTPDDTEPLTGYIEVVNAARAVDSPWEPPLTLHEKEGDLRHGWDGEPSQPYLGTEGGVPVAVGSVSVSNYDNLHLAWLGVQVHPEHRRRGLGSTMLGRMVDEAQALGRTVVGSDGWDGTGASAFAARHGFEPKSAAVNRRQILSDVDWEVLEKLHAEALAAAAPYEVVRRVGATPDDEMDAVATMTAAINDAPTDDLDLEDEVFTPDRVRAYEAAWAARGHTLYRVLARHRETGELAGHSVVSVDGERPELAEQHDTSVVASHRGHKLGLLLKTEMNLWLRDVEPQLVSVDTWNAESNGFMIGVNDAIGYRIMGREIEFQKRL